MLNEIIGAGGVGSIDMVFCDVGDRERYPHMHEQLMQVVRVGGLVVYYDTLWAADEINTHPPFPTMRKFAESLAKDPRVIATMVPLSYGFTLCVKAMDLPAKPLEQARNLGDISRRDSAVDARGECNARIGARGGRVGRLGGAGRPSEGEAGGGGGGAQADGLTSRRR